MKLIFSRIEYFIWSPMKIWTSFTLYVGSLGGLSSFHTFVYKRTRIRAAWSLFLSIVDWKIHSYISLLWGRLLSRTPVFMDTAVCLHSWGRCVATFSFHMFHSQLLRLQAELSPEWVQGGQIHEPDGVHCKIYCLYMFKHVVQRVTNDRQRSRRGMVWGRHTHTVQWNVTKNVRIYTHKVTARTVLHRWQCDIK